MWKQVEVPCSQIFTTFPTDRGFCCSFNIDAADNIFIDSQYTSLVKSLNKIDQELAVERVAMPDFYVKRSEPMTQAGKNLGLTVVLDAHSNVIESVSASSDYEGFVGLITNPGNFLLTNSKGFEIQPGHNNLVAVSAIMIQADDDLVFLDPDTRQCLFPGETDRIKLHKSYTQENCFLECSLIFAQNKLKDEQNLGYLCTPWYFPFVDENYTMCDPWQTVRISQIMQNDVSSEQCSYCLPDCVQTIYRTSTTTQQFRRCDERNLELTKMCSILRKNITKPEIWGRQVLDYYLNQTGKIPDYLSNITSSKRMVKKSYLLNYVFPGLSREYDAFDKDIAVLTVFFDSTTVMAFNSASTQSWIDYWSNVGGALGLCIGLSIITVVEMFWLCLSFVGIVNSKKITMDN